MIENILIAVLGGGNLLRFVKFLIERHDETRGIGKTLRKLEKDGLRTQLLLLILMKPEEKKEILTLAEHYFVDLKGNWYMTDVFNSWLEQEKHGKPEWFKKEN